MTGSKGRLHGWMGAGLGIVAFVVYLFTLSVGAYPGESSLLITQNTGLFLRMAPPRPLWGAIAWLLSKIPVGSLVTRLNVLSSVGGVVAVFLMYRVMAGAVYGCIEITERNRNRSSLAAIVAGAVSALSLAFCIPFWVVSTRAHTASLSLVLLLLCAQLLLAYAQSGVWKTALLFALLYGAGIAEFATLIVMAPLFGGLLLYMMWQREQLRVRAVAGLLAVGFTGAILLYLASAWCFYETPGYHLREFQGFWHIMWITWRDQYFLIVHSLPRQGWLLVLVLTIIPWLTMLTVARRALNGEKDWAFYVLNVVFTALALATLFNIKVAPWPMLGMQRLLVTPYVLTASLFGYVAAYWFLLPSALWPYYGNDPPTARVWWMSGLLTVSLTACALATPFLNLRTADGRQARDVSRFARQIVASLDGRSWLVTDGSLDDQLRIAADEMNVPLTLLSLAWDGRDSLMKHAASLFDDVRLQNRARIGMLPLLREWCDGHPEVQNQIAFFANPDVLVSCGLTPVPHKLVFVAGETPNGEEVDALMALHQRFWEDNADLLMGPQVADAFVARFCAHLRRHAALVANNLGVLMEDVGSNDNAAVAYRKAREIDPENISALLNLHAMVKRDVLRDDGGAIQDQLDALMETLGKRRVRIWSLSRDYGYVRTPGAFVDLGWYWAASGQPGMAASGLKKAMALLPDDRQGPVKQVLADVYLMQDREEESETLYYELLVENPLNQRALLGMARIKISRGELDEAGKYLTKAEAADVPKPLMELEWATLDVVAGRTDQAVGRLEALLAEKPKLLRAWALLTGIFIQQNDVVRLAEAVGKMESLRFGANTVVPIARGHLAVLSDDLDGACEAFEQASRQDPRNIKILEWLLKLDMIQSRESAARSHLESILKLDPDHAFANRILGTLQYAEGEYKLAEDSLRRSVKRQSDPETLNDLAWLLQESGLYEEAEKHVRSSLEMDIENYHAWDTLGMIFMKTGRYAAAAKSLEQASSLSNNQTDVLLHTAELLILQEKRAEAVAVLEALALQSDDMTAADREQLDVLRQKISRLQ